MLAARPSLSEGLAEPSPYSYSLAAFLVFPPLALVWKYAQEGGIWPEIPPVLTLHKPSPVCGIDPPPGSLLPFQYRRSGGEEAHLEPPSLLSLQTTFHHAALPWIIREVTWVASSWLVVATTTTTTTTTATPGSFLRYSYLSYQASSAIIGQ